MRWREALEGLSVRLAAEQTLTDDPREALRASQARLDAAEAAKAVEAYAQENQAYHRLIAGLADNRYVTELIEKVRVPLLGLKEPPSYTHAALVASNEGHRFITYAIFAGVPDEAFT